MARLRIAPIVEGRGEVNSVRILLERLWYEEFKGEFLRVEQPIFKPKGTLRDDAAGLCRAVRSVLEKLDEPTPLPERKMILILLDSDDPDEKNCPAKMGPRLQALAQDVDSRIEVACVVDLAACRSNSRSFRKLCKELELRLALVGPSV